MKIRPATIDDIPHLVQFGISANGGIDEVLYEGLLTGQSLESALEPYYHQSGSTDFFENHWVAEKDGKVAGGVNAYPFDDMENDPPPDPRVPEDRFVIFQPFTDLPANGTYFVNIISVYPEYSRQGIAAALLTLACEQARAKAFSEIGLHVYGGNVGAVALYESLGFKVVGRGPIVEHPFIPYTGEAFLMVASLGE